MFTAQLLMFAVMAIVALVACVLVLALDTPTLWLLLVGGIGAITIAGIYISTLT